jgi:hypothetical protein
MDLKQWQCKNKHALGMIRVNGNDVPQLMLYRHAVDLTADQPAQVDVMIGPLVGQMPVQCDICGDVKVWGVSVDALADLIRGLRHEQMVQLQARLLKGRVKKVQKHKNRARLDS